MPAAELHIEGLNNRYREAGIGAPLAGEPTRDSDERGFQVARPIKVPVTALLRVDLAPGTIASGHISGALTVYPGNSQRLVTIGAQQVPPERGLRLLPEQPGHLEE